MQGSKAWSNRTKISCVVFGYRYRPAAIICRPYIGKRIQLNSSTLGLYSLTIMASVLNKAITDDGSVFKPILINPLTYNGVPQVSDVAKSYRPNREKTPDP